MKVLVLMVLFAIPFSLCAKDLYLADRHAKYGADCASCHEIKEPKAGATVDMPVCLSCHESYDVLKKSTQRYAEYNPHNNHLGEIDCTVCHSGHTPSTVYCKTCHDDMKVNIK